jgi:UDP-3-O-[3-hydroxymyristoyl] glucosamine N-acyltransferase
MTVREIAAWFGGEVVGNPEQGIDRVAKIEEAQPGSITFLANPKYTKFLQSTQASAVLVGKAFIVKPPPFPEKTSLIAVDDPYLSFLVVLKKLTPEPEPFAKGIHDSAAIHADATIGSNVSVGANAVILAGARVGANTKIGPGVVIGKEAVVGEACVLYANLTINHQCKIGNRVTLHSGVVIGSDGFGFAPLHDGTFEKIPQFGIVVIEDDVEIGANTCIDRATVGETRIGKGVKLDNLIHVAHNCSIGEHTVIAALTGMAGSTKIGKHVMIGGMCSINGHIEIADRTTVMAVSFITKSISQPGTTVFGTPAHERRRALRIEGGVRMLPDLIEEFRALKNEVERLRMQVGQK